jgi:hypothetical protein
VHEIIRATIHSKISIDTDKYWSFCTLFLYYYLRTLFDFSWLSIRNFKIAIEQVIPSKSLDSTLEYSLVMAYMISKILAVTLLMTKLVDLYLSDFDIFQLSISLQEAILFVSCCVTTAFYTRYLIIVSILCGGIAPSHPMSYNRAQQIGANALFEN